MKNSDGVCLCVCMYAMDVQTTYLIDMNLFRCAIINPGPLRRIKIIKMRIKMMKSK